MTVFCMMGGGCLLSVPMAHLETEQRFRLQAGLGDRGRGETHGKRVRGSGPKAEATSGPWSRYRQQWVLRSRDRRNVATGLWGKPCSLRTLTDHSDAHSSCCCLRAVTQPPRPAPSLRVSVHPSAGPRSQPLSFSLVLGIVWWTSHCPYP